MDDLILTIDGLTQEIGQVRQELENISYSLDQIQKVMKISQGLPHNKHIGM